MFSHVLVPLDPSVRSKTTLMTATAISAMHGAQLTLLYVSDSREEREDADRFIGDVAALVYEHGGRPEIRTARGAAADKIIRQIAGKLHADLIVMDARQRGATEFYGNVPVMMIHEAEMPRPRSLAAWFW
jgi:nucleotide-binding universal stress UspA family protein